MRWPWVSRRKFEWQVGEGEDARRVQEIWRERVVQAESLAEARQEFVDFLVGEIKHLRSEIQRKDLELLELRREGFASPEPEPEPPGIPGSSLPEAVLAAIEEVTQPGSGAMAREIRNAETSLGAGEVSDEDAADLAASIRLGSPLNPHWL